ncbi:MAG: alpha-galactosidase, partial [Armatimonadota bacterium]
MKARSGGIAPRLGLVLVGSTLVACVAVVVTLPLAAAESAAVGGLSVECDLEQAAFALRMDPVGVFLRGPLPSLAAGPGPLVRPGQHDWAQAESLRTDTGGRRLTVTFCPEEAADAPDLVYTFGISGDGRHVDLCAEVADAAQPLRSRLQAQVTWGQAGFPCRLEPGDHPEVVQMALGDVSSRLCHSLFDPQTDAAVTFGGGKLTIAPPTADGGHTLTVESESDRVGPVEAFAVEVTPDYFRRGRGIQWYAPLDKSAFGEPPNGWCSWHYYYAGINEEEMVKNTDWLAENLKPFGLEYVQLDDGYQTESWTEWNAKFPHGGKWLADYIHTKGLRAGLWLTPFSQGDPELVEQHPDWFLRDAEGKAVET